MANCQLFFVEKFSWKPTDTAIQFHAFACLWNIIAVLAAIRVKLLKNLFYNNFFMISNQFFIIEKNTVNCDCKQPETKEKTWKKRFFFLVYCRTLMKVTSGNRKEANYFCKERVLQKKKCYIWFIRIVLWLKITLMEKTLFLFKILLEAEAIWIMNKKHQIPKISKFLWITVFFQ